MLTIEQYQILNACADDVELFYICFACINYGGQVFPSDAGPDYAQYVTDRSWTVRYAASDIVADLSHLIDTGLLLCWVIVEPGVRQPVRRSRDTEFWMYAGYQCLTWDDHIAHFDYGPHEFKTSDAGLAELRKDEYALYDNALGWSE